MAANINNYISAGNAAINSALRSLQAARENAPDYGDIQNEGIILKAQEKQQAIQASTQTQRANIQADGLLDRTELKIDRDKSVRKSRRKQAFAGKLAAVGTLIGSAFEPGPRIIEPTAIDYSKSIEKTRQARDKTIADIAAIQDGTYRGLGSSTLLASAQSPAETAPSGGGLTSSAQAVQSGKGSGSSGGKFNLSQMQQLLEEQGMSADNARILAAVGMGESGGDPGIDTVQSGLDPNRSNEYSLGLFQINAQAHGDKLKRRGYSVEDLRDPAKNAAIAVDVFREAGNSFRPWSVYQKGLHKQYLQ